MDEIMKMQQIEFLKHWTERIRSELNEILEANKRPYTESEQDNLFIAYSHICIAWEYLDAWNALNTKGENENVY